MTVMALLWPALRAGLFALDAERAHHLVVRGGAIAPRLAGAVTRLLLGRAPAPCPVLVGGVTWKNPVGLAAGLDKDGVAIPLWARLGFGSVEVGTVTAFPQPGNPLPRLFRLPSDGALINRMGFNNEGSEALMCRLRSLRESGRWPDIPVGANIGKSRVTAVAEATSDYVVSARRLGGLVDWLTVNVSSPNTPGLRGLQDAGALAQLLPAVVDAAGGTPVWLKLAPDLDDDAISAAVEVAAGAGIRAVVATNTTLSRDGLRADPNEAGGLSGRPLYPLAGRAIEAALRSGRIPVVAAGGIETGTQVQERLAAGCAAVQLYSAFVYGGPSLPDRLVRTLA